MIGSCGGNDSYYNYDLPEKGKKNINYKIQDTTKNYEGMSLKEMSYHSEVDKTIGIKNILYEKKMKHFFSNSKNKDEFYVIINGEQYYNASINFTIKNADGEEIYNDNFPCINILDEAFDGGGHYATNLQREAYMKKYVFDFFQNNNFKQPAIDDEREFNEDYASVEDWDDIKADKESIVFTYWMMPSMPLQMASVWAISARSAATKCSSLPRSAGALMSESRK